MMLMPQTAAQYGVKDICNPVENVRGSMLFLKDLAAEFQGNMMLVAAAYNAGSERVIQAKGVPANSETVRYVAAVTNQYYGLGDLSARPRKAQRREEPRRSGSFRKRVVASRKEPLGERPGVDRRVGSLRVLRR